METTSATSPASPRNGYLKHLERFWERYLTRILEEHVHDKFSKHVTMRKCRSINITYEGHHAKSMKEIHLAEQLGNRFTTLHQSSQKNSLQVLLFQTDTNVSGDDGLTVDDDLGYAMLLILILRHYDGDRGAENWVSHKF
ncbi:hypothetical protein GN244_ATG11268 [Phytophthora infestans]|uniref:Uncharacterized protein n=1 Tax=Phytophthora infestans TaxID=4787 RepID=A0A833WII1_PHYIN|nr:hypothetical protein GN244_ATG11268 [Phytophthora infestans]